MATEIKTRHIKVSNRIKWYFVKLISPITSFKKWFLADLIVDAERLEHRVDSLENQTNIDDVEQRVENIEYDLEARIESLETNGSETNQEIADKFNKIDDDINYCKEYVIENRLDNVSCETFNKLADRVKSLENCKAIENVYEDVDRCEKFNKSLDERVETLESETATIYDIKNLEARIDSKEIREIVAEVLCDKGLQLNLLDQRINRLENREGEQEDIRTITESSLSAMQKLSFEICHYYGGDFNLDDFNNCYDIIKKYDIKGGK